jgi:hypothetical protein
VTAVIKKITSTLKNNLIPLPEKKMCLNISKLFIRSLVSLFLFAASFNIVSAKPVTIADGFAPGNQERQVGGTIDGESTETSNAIWSTHPDYIFGTAGDNGFIIPNKTSSLTAAVPLPNATYSITIEADIKVKAAKAGWIGLGFTNSNGKSNSSWQGGAFVIINNAGQARGFANGLKIKLPAEKIPNYTPDSVVHLKVIYNQTSNKMSAWADKTPVFIDADLTKHDFTPSLLYAGFSSYGASNESSIDNITIKADQDASKVKKSAAVKAKPANSYRILFMGNSITRHGPSKKLKWNYTAGMAASSEATDYVHQFVDKVAKALPAKIVEPVFLAHGGGVVSSFVGRATDMGSLQPDVVVIQLGENDRAAMGPEKFKAVYSQLVQEIKSITPRPLIICTGVWSPNKGGSYGGWAKTREDAIMSITKAEKVLFAPVIGGAQNPAFKGFGQHSGVQWHPNDAGMTFYANSIFSQWKSAQ